MTVYVLDGVAQDLPDEGSYWIAPSACVIGKVRLERFASVWFGAVVRSGTPAPVVQRLNEEIVKVMKNPEVTKRFSDLGLEPMPMSTAQFAGFLQTEITRWTALVKASGASID